MAPGTTKVSAAGVADGKQLLGIPTGDDVCAEQRVKALLWGSMSEEMYQGWAATLIRTDLSLVSAAASGHVVFVYTVPPAHGNPLGNLHGGCTATIFDVCTTAALAPVARPGFWVGAGVSRTLHVTYLRPIPVGERVLVECEVVHAGRRLCTLKGTMRRETDGKVLAICEHGKVSSDPAAAGKM
ncbi:thioesterase superfamily protein [Diplocarpon rosae]|nr:thioesterase superfamily protein [Diplocarpon rosae]